MFQKNSIPSGRKYRLSILCILVILAGWFGGGINPVFSAGYEEMIAGILGVLFTYCGGNVANKWAVKGKNLQINQGSETEVG